MIKIGDQVRLIGQVPKSGLTRGAVGSVLDLDLNQGDAMVMFAGRIVCIPLDLLALTKPLAKMFGADT